MKMNQRSQEHQRRVLDLRRSGATQWDRRVKSERTRKAQRDQWQKEQAR
jgi:hypothetical protein